MFACPLLDELMNKSNNNIIIVFTIIIHISHLVYLYYRASRGLTRIFSLPEGYKGKYGS